MRIYTYPASAPTLNPRISRVDIVGGVYAEVSTVAIGAPDEATLAAFFNPIVELTRSTSFDCVGPVESNPTEMRSTQNYEIHINQAPDDFAPPIYTEEGFPLLGVLDDSTALYFNLAVPGGNQLTSPIETLFDTLIASVP